MDIKDINDVDYPAILKFCNGFNLVLLKLDAGLSVTDANQTALGLFDLTYSNVISRSLADVCNKIGIVQPIKSRPAPDLLELNPSSSIFYSGKQIDISWSYSKVLNSAGLCSGFLILGKTFNPVEITDRFVHLKLLDKLLYDVAANVFSKSLNGTQLFANQPLADCAGLKIEDMLGRNDYNLPWAECADKLVEADNVAINTKQTIVTEEKMITASGERCVYVSTKSPLYDSNDNIVGTFGMAINIKKVKRASQFEQLPQEKVLFDRKNPIALSSREIECINWMVKGKSAEEIGKILNLSRRTIETHIENIKAKTKCYKQFQLGYVIGKYTSSII